MRYTKNPSQKALSFSQQLITLKTSIVMLMLSFVHLQTLVAAYKHVDCRLFSTHQHTHQLHEICD